MFPYCPNILLITAAAERRGIKPYRLTPNKQTYKYEPGKPITIEKSKRLSIERSKSRIFFAV
jgi:hypothetical protein